MKIDKMEKDELTYHVPVLLKESVDGMNIHPDGTYVDVTFGGAGHSREILSRLGEGGRLLGFDQDEDAEIRRDIGLLEQDRAEDRDLAEQRDGVDAECVAEDDLLRAEHDAGIEDAERRSKRDDGRRADGLLRLQVDGGKGVQGAQEHTGKDRDQDRDQQNEP